MVETMKILRKIAMIMMVGVVADCAQAVTVLGFDTIVSGLATIIPSSLQPKIYIHEGSSRYVYFTVIPNPAVLPAPISAAFQRAAVPNPPDPHFAGGFNIFFPADGHQPTTPEAVEYSCANIDNRENSPITEWYMMMFGVIPFQNAGTPGANDYIKAGWNNSTPHIAQQIITFNANITWTSNVTDQDDKKSISKKELFIKKFRKIASTSVGRVLLYRVLIELRRQSRRDVAGSIEIMYGTFSFESGDHASVSFFHEIKEQWAIGNEKITKTDQVATKGTVIVQVPLHTSKPLDIALLHEMIHWFHYLKDPDRYKKEVSFVESSQNDKISNNDICRYYWSELSKLTAQKDEVGVQLLKKIWSLNGFALSGNFEEIRTILGMTQNVRGYQNGDDISENLYRRERHFPLRYGYNVGRLWEDKSVIDKIALDNHIIIQQYCIPIVWADENVEMSNRKKREKGIGNCFYESN
ncbi:MAG: hypothetical protein LBF44_01900 [Holosporaceae bacterium]|jgi:hypothetical protein|nr:hypothetical protein [Holosporaceae bacterium]